MGIFSRFEGRMEDGIEGAADRMFDAPISPVQISKKAEKAMRREKMVGAGRQYAPTLYTVLVNPDDDARLFGYYPTLAGETETYLAAKAQEEGLAMDGQPLVRFIVDDGLRHGKFDIVAEMVSAPIIAQLRQEEMARYGLVAQSSAYFDYGQPPAQQYSYQDPAQQYAYQEPVQQAPRQHEPLPYVPEDEIDRSIDYGEYTFNSQDWDSYQNDGVAGDYAPATDVRESYRSRSSQPFDDGFAPDADGDIFAGLDVSAYDPNVNSGSFDAGFTPAPAGEPITRYIDDEAEEKEAEDDEPIAFMPAQLINTATNRAYRLDSERLILGRSSASNIIVDDINASRSHAELRFEPEGYWVITDLGSMNGTYVNGQRVTTVPLNEGDRISVGMTHLVFTLR